MRLPTILIPAYKPGAHFVEFVHTLKERGYEDIVVVDDGSGAEFVPQFSAIRDIATILRHERNQGKGKALKTGFSHIIATAPHCMGVVTVDADAQHHIDDIQNVAASLAESPESCVLGVRFTDRTAQRVPLRNAIGNRLTRLLFSLQTGWSLSDTQSGLRGLPLKECEKALALPGDRYEFEMQMLTQWARDRTPVVEQPIRTIYPEEGTSHFHPIVDSMKIYWVLLRFTVSSLAATFIDYLIYSTLILLDQPIWVSLACARATSTIVNFIANKNLVFHSRGSTIRQILSYYAFALLLFLLSWGGIVSMGKAMGMNPIISKIIIESLLFALSFTVQKHLVFRAHDRQEK